MSAVVSNVSIGLFFNEKYYLFKRAHGDMVELLTLNTALFDAENEWKLKRLTPTKVKELVEWKLEESESNDGQQPLKLFRCLL